MNIQNPYTAFALLALLLVIAYATMKIELRRKNLSQLVASQANARSIGKKLELRLVRIEPGDFLMGSPLTERRRDGGATELQHQVTVTRSFQMSAVPITRQQFASFVEAAGYRSTVEGGGGSYRWAWGQCEKTPGVTWAADRVDSHPVTRVSWEDAVAFCQWASMVRSKTIRLPTEAEWEYTCRAGSTKSFAGSGVLNEMGWFAGNSGEQTLDCDALMAQGSIQTIATIVRNNCMLHSVGLKKPNSWGLYDMHGNTWEWCSDAFAPYTDQPAVDPTGPAVRNPKWRVMRGGQWADIPSTCRSANRGNFRPRDSFDTFGFRVVEEI